MILSGFFISVAVTSCRSSKAPVNELVVEMDVVKAENPSPRCGACRVGRVKFASIVGRHLQRSVRAVEKLRRGPCELSKVPIVFIRQFEHLCVFSFGAIGFSKIKGQRHVTFMLKATDYIGDWAAFPEEFKSRELWVQHAAIEIGLLTFVNYFN